VKKTYIFIESFFVNEINYSSLAKMLDKVNKPITEDEQLMLQQLIENLAQQSDSQQQMSGVDSSGKFNRAR
jgi:hypothetical protein